MRVISEKKFLKKFEFVPLHENIQTQAEKKLLKKFI